MVKSRDAVHRKPQAAGPNASEAKAAARGWVAFTTAEVPDGRFRCVRFRPPNTAWAVNVTEVNKPEKTWWFYTDRQIAEADAKKVKSRPSVIAARVVAAIRFDPSIHVHGQQ
jgi:hypothetical protein